MADENRKASRIPGISKYKAPGESLVKINQGDVANSQLFLPDVDDPSTYDEWGKLFNTLTFPQLTGSLKELKAFLDEWKLLGDATIAKSNSSEYSILNNNLKTIGVKVGFSDLTTTDTSRLFVHGFDKEGRPADKDGFFFLNDDLTESANAENPAVESGTTGSIVAERVTINKASLGPISTTFVNQITFLIIEKSGAVFVPRLISLPKDQINELATDYKFNAWDKASDSLSSASTITTNLSYPSAPTNYANWYDSASGDSYNPYTSEVDSIVTRETTNWNSTSRTVTAPANVSNYSIKTRLLKEIFVLGICDTKLVSSKVVFNNFSMFPTPVSFLSFQLLFEADRNFLDFRVKDFKDKEALFKKIHDEINNRVLDTNKIKGEIDRNLRPYTLKKQNEAGEDLIVLEYFNNTANSAVQSLFKNDVLDNATAYPAGLATRKRLFSASLLNDDLDEVWLHGRNSAKVLKLGLAGSTTNATTELLTGFKINGDLLTTGTVSMSSTLDVTGAVTLSSTLAVAGNTTLTGDLAVNGGNLTSSASTFNLLTASSGQINAFSASGIISIGCATTGAQTIGIGNGSTVTGQTKTINIGQNGVTGSTTTLNIGSAAGTTNINTYGTHAHAGAKTISSTLTVAGVTTLNDNLVANNSVVLGGAASDSLTVNATSNFIGPVTIANLLITGSTIEDLTVNNSFLSKGSNIFDQLIYAKAAINSDTDIVALGEVKANKLKEKYLTTGIEKYLGDIYQAKYEGSAGVNVLNLPKKTILAITNGARAFCSVGVLEPANYLTGTYDSANKIYSNVDYKFGVSFENDWLVFKNDSFIKYPAITGTKTDFTIYTCFDDTLAQTAASTTYEFLKFTNDTETLEIGFATNVEKDNLSLVIKRNGTSLVDTITTWPATATAKTAGEVFRDKNIKNRSISFNLFNNVLSVVVGGELVASYVFAALTNNLTTLTVGKSSTNALICSIKSLVIGQFSASEFSKYTSAWVPNVDYNQELQSNEGKFYIKKELDYVEIVSGKRKPILLDTINSFKKQNTFEVETVFLKPITITDNGRSTTISNHATADYGTTIVSGGETSIYFGSTSYNKPRYNDGSTINDILTEKHAIQTPDGKTIALSNGASLDTLTKTGLNDVYGFASAPTSSKSWFVDTKVAAAGTSYMRENIQSFDGLEDYFRIKNGGSFGSWIKNWNANNDGSGSGLDADLLRGLNSATTNTASTVVTRGTSGEFAAGVVTVTGLTNSGNASMAGTLSVTGNTTLTGGLAVNGGYITSSATTFNLLTGTLTNGNLFDNASVIKIGSAFTGTQTLQLGTGATISGSTKSLHLGTNGVTGSTTNIYIGSTTGTSAIALQGNANVTSNFSVAGVTTLTGQLISNGSLTAGTEGFKTGPATIKYNTTTKSLDFVFA